MCVELITQICILWWNFELLLIERVQADKGNNKIDGYAYIQIYLPMILDYKFEINYIINKQDRTTQIHDGEHW